MSTRRVVLSLGVLALVVSAAHRVGASGPVDLEGGAYGGQASGNWACGPRSQVKYGGVGAEVHAHPTAPEGERTGLAVVAGTAVEERGAYQNLDCVSAPASDACKDPVPSGGVTFGSRAAVGWDWRYFGVTGGVLVWNRFVNNTDANPTLSVAPDVALRIGRFDGLRFTMGIGAYNVPTLLRPGLYGGVGYSPARGWDIDLHGGLNATFDGSWGAREDLALRVPLLPHLQLGFGGALSQNLAGYVDPEGRVFLVGAL